MRSAAPFLFSERLTVFSSCLLAAVHRLASVTVAVALFSGLQSSLFAQSLTNDSAVTADSLKTTKWHGFDRCHFTIADRPAWIVVPAQTASGKPWVWRARFPDFHYEMDVELLKQGFHIGYVDVAGLFGSPQAMQIADAFYQDLTVQRGLAQKPALEGVSRGGLLVYNWAARHPDKVACIYCDTPVLDFKSWPGGQGIGLGSAEAWKQCLAAWKMTEQEALTFQGQPLDHAAVIAKHRIPVMHIISENDAVVPPSENTKILQQRLQQHGHDMTIISVAQGTEESHGHHFTHPEPDRVVQFIRQHASP
jgi:pimeloyl-ACP methyl ester carboxylesterase